MDSIRLDEEPILKIGSRLITCLGFESLAIRQFVVMIMEKTELEKMVALHEGYRKHMYLCTKGKRTIGYGFNIDAGMPEDEAHMLMRMRLQKINAEYEKRYPWYKTFPEKKKYILLDMGYQMGVDGVDGFTNFIKACSENDWTKAAVEMLDSKWAKKDTPKRAKQLSELMSKE